MMKSLRKMKLKKMLDRDAGGFAAGVEKAGTGRVRAGSAEEGSEAERR